MKEHNTQQEPTFKEALEASVGNQVSEQEAFDFQYDLVELLRILSEIEQALPATDVHTRQLENGPFQGGVTL